MRVRAPMKAKQQGLGPTALVSGASDGIGAATARELARAGFDLVITARREDRLQGLAQQIREEAGVTVDVIIADLGSSRGIDHLRQNLDWRDIGVAVLSAGFGSSGPFIRTDLETERTMLTVNCEATLALSRDLADRMARRGAGQLVLLSSVVGFQGNGSSANYSATKAYVQALAEGLATELKSSGVQVLAIAPGPVQTGFGDRAQMTLGRAERPETVARGIIRSLGRRGTVRPGFLAKLLGYSLAITPRFLRTQILTKIMGEMAALPNAHDRLGTS